MTQCMTSRASSRRSIAAWTRCGQDPAVWRQPGTIGWEATDTKDMICTRRAGKAKSKVPEHPLHWLYTGSHAKTCLGSVNTTGQ